MKKALFINEADLCAQFVSDLPEGWTSYAETAGFDLLLVRSDGAQIGIEAKMTLNAKVILQVISGGEYWSSLECPDFRAVLVPYGTAGLEMRQIANRLGVTVIEMHTPATFATASPWVARTGAKRVKLHDPVLPKIDAADWEMRSWVDLLPVERCKLPDYVPDIGGGHSAPMQLSEWKIKAIKIAILLEVNGFVTWRDFKHLMINKQRWLVMGWLQQSSEPGKLVRGPIDIGLQKQHPVNFEQIRADFEKWRPKDEGLPL